ncbi:MAG: flagellar biosynthetic protein FliR [Micavibrio sp.]|nr:flagellar biosynthetic protein FliR [Micavibrio sp.]
MQSMLNDIVAGNVQAFLLIFMRFGMALMVMPGIGDSFTSPQVRLHFALAMTLVMTPFLSPSLPALPSNSADMIALLLSEAFIGLFIGMVMRIMVTALDTAGAIISIQSGFSNGTIFNPQTATQGTMIGGFYTMLGVVLLFVSNMHHYMLAAVVESYQLFPAMAKAPDMLPLMEVMTRTVSTAFRIGVQMSFPFLVVGLLIQIAFGVLGRLMPQVQIFFIAQPLQIMLSLVILSMCLSAGMLYWLGAFKDVVATAMSP